MPNPNLTVTAAVTATVTAVIPPRRAWRRVSVLDAMLVSVITAYRFTSMSADLDRPTYEGGLGLRLGLEFVPVFVFLLGVVSVLVLRLVLGYS